VLRVSCLEILGASISWIPKGLSRSVMGWLSKCRASVSRVRIALVTVILHLRCKMNFLTDLDDVCYRGSPCNPGAHVFNVVQGGTFKPIDLKGAGGGGGGAVL